MTFSQAKKEFEIRYYLWAISEFKREIENSFPRFSSFKSGAVWQTLHFMNLLGKDQQLILAHALLKRFHPGAVNYLGEDCSSEEENLRSRRDSFFHIWTHYDAVRHCRSNGMTVEAEHLFQTLRDDLVLAVGDTGWSDDESLRSEADRLFDGFPTLLERKIETRKQAGEKLRFASKRKILGAIKAKFESAFGSRCLRPLPAGNDEDLTFRTSCYGWIIQTHFWFGRQASLLDYSHSIVSEATCERAGNELPVMTLAQLISFSAWLGLTSQTQWEYLNDEDVDPVCEAAIKHCDHFFVVAPKLLKGLDASALTVE